MARLAATLGLVTNAKVALVNVRPETHALLPIDDVFLYDRAAEPLDVVIYCSDELASVARRVPVLAGFVRAGGLFWLGYPDAGSRLTTDVTAADAVRIGAEAGLEPGDAVRLGDWMLASFRKPGG